MEILNDFDFPKVTVTYPRMLWHLQSDTSLSRQILKTNNIFHSILLFTVDNIRICVI